MVSRRITLPLALAASLAVALPAGAAQASSGAPVAHSAGGDAPPLTPSVVGVPLARADKAINNAADAIDAGNGAQAVGPLKASRRYMIRAYRGAKYLIAASPPAPADDARALPVRQVRPARAPRRSRLSHRGATPRGSWIRAQASQFAPPVLADTPTAVFSVFQGQYDVATAAVGMLPDVTGRAAGARQDQPVHGDRPAQPPGQDHARRPPRPRPRGRPGDRPTATTAQEEDAPRSTWSCPA